MNKNYLIITTILLLFSLLTFVISTFIIYPNKWKNYLIEFIQSIESNDNNKINKILLEISNSGKPEEYNFFYGLLKFYNGEEEEGTKILTSISNSNLNEEEKVIMNFLVGEYLLFNKDVSGIPLLLSKECYNIFSNYVNYTIGIYNFDKGNYEEALEFLYSATNIENQEIKKEVLLRITFIYLLKEGKIESNIISEIEKLESNKNFISNIINQFKIFY
ncbi:MAG: hypothetical protein ACP5KI_04920 [Brevinematia bacterium]